MVEPQSRNSPAYEVAHVKAELAERTLFERAQVEQTCDTTTAAALIHKPPQTLRRWACEGNGPVQPVRINGRLHWSVAKLRALAEHGSDRAA